MTTEILPPPGIPKETSNGAGEKLVAVTAPLVSILIPCCGMLEYTQMCVTSVLKNTRLPFELIFLDVGSLDGTAEYLAGVATGLARLRIEVVRARTDMGIPFACREALEMCRGEFLVLLNNDTIVTRGWINQLTGLMALSPSIGIVGPMSNYAAMPQLVEGVPYRSGPRKNLKTGLVTGASRGLVDPEAVQAFANKVHEENKGKWAQTDQLSGFCLMFKRELYKRLDQQGELSHSELGLFDTDLLCSRAHLLGFNLAVCQDLFIHHFGTRTFAHGAPAAVSAGQGQR